MNTIRKNQHQTHIESLVLLGKDGLAELEDKFEGLLDEIDDSSNKRLNHTTKVDGAPAVVMWSKYEGLPDNSISLKSFITGSSANCLSSEEDIDAKYGDREDMAQKLKYCLKLAHCIPEGEAWQGDCLYTNLDTRTIDGVNYLTFHPNKIVYAVSEDSPAYNDIEQSSFGICVHTVYKGATRHQSFDVDLSRLHGVPSDIYVMTPDLDISQGEFDTGALRTMYNNFLTLANKLMNDPLYDEVCDNEYFMKYWSMFENASTSDKGSATISKETFYQELVDFIDTKQKTEYDKKMASLKTDKAKEQTTAKYDQSAQEMHDILEKHKTVLYDIVEVFNAAAGLKMAFLKAIENIPQQLKTFLLSKTRGYIPTGAEGVSVSDMDGNIVKLVDRATFSHANRNDDYVSGFMHESLEGNKTAVVGLGRMNPVTVGHAKLANTIISKANEVGGDPMLFLTHTQDSSKNPLPYESKIKWAKKAFGDLVVDSPLKTIIEVLTDLDKKGYTDIVYVGGADRIGGDEDVTKMIDRYNGQPDKKGNIPYQFNSIEYVSAGDRDDNADDITTKASASLARQYVRDNNLEGFKSIVPFSDADAEELYNELKGLLKEDYEVNEDEFGLNEAMLGNTEFDKHNFKYFDAVVNDLFGDGVVDGAGDTHTLSDESKRVELEKIKEITDNSDRAKLFNDIAGFKWNTIDKSKYSNYQNRGLEAETLVVDDQSIVDEIVERIKEVIGANEIVVNSIDHVGGENNRRKEDFVELFAKRTPKTDGPGTGASIADVIYHATVDGVDKDLFLSIKYGPTTSQINLGLQKVSADDIINTLLSSYSKDEEILLRSFLELRGKVTSINVVATDKESGDRYEEFKYEFDPSKVNGERLKNAFINAYGGNYFYVHMTGARIDKLDSIENIVKELDEKPVNSTRLTVTHARMIAEFVMGDKKCRLFFRRKGSPSMFLLGDSNDNLTPTNIGGHLLEDAGKYRYSLEQSKEG